MDVKRIDTKTKTTIPKEDSAMGCKKNYLITFLFCGRIKKELQDINSEFWEKLKILSFYLTILFFSQF